MTYIVTSCFYVSDKRADILQKVDVRVVANTKCNEWYANQNKLIHVESKQMCAGWEKGGKDTCYVSKTAQCARKSFRVMQNVREDITCVLFLHSRIAALVSAWRLASLVNQPITKFTARWLETTQISINTHSIVRNAHTILFGHDSRPCWMMPLLGNWIV